MNFEFFAVLIVSHIIGDFAMQFDPVFRLKTQGGWSGLLVHIVIHVVLLAFLVTGPWGRVLQMIAVLGTVHYAIDWLKLRLQGDRRLLGAYLVDQAAHFTSIVLIVFLWPELDSLIPAPYVYLMAAYALVPAVTMTLWVWAFDRLKVGQDSPRAARWRKSMKLVSQASGWPLNIAVFVLIYQNYVQPLL